MRDAVHKRHGVLSGLRSALGAFACAACLSVAAFAQTAGQADEGAPPKKYIPEGLRAQLSASKNIKERVKLTIVLAEEKLRGAAAHTDAERYAEAGGELGIYQALVDDAITYVKRHGRDDNKTRDIFKRLELALRSHVPRIESLRRATPSEEAVYVRDCIEFVRLARARALESFFDDDVIEVPPPKKKDRTNEGSAENKPAAPPEKKPEQR